MDGVAKADMAKIVASLKMERENMTVKNIWRLKMRINLCCIADLIDGVRTEAFIPHIHADIPGRRASQRLFQTWFYKERNISIKLMLNGYRTCNMET